jgi:hypothetical protein
LSALRTEPRAANGGAPGVNQWKLAMAKNTGRKQLPGAQAEFDELAKQINALLDRTQDGKGETMRIVIDLPREWALLATWLTLKWRRRHREDFEPLPHFDLLTDRMIRHWTRTYVRLELNNHFHNELHTLSAGVNSLLYPPEKEEKSPIPDMDDGIPF